MEVAALLGLLCGRMEVGWALRQCLRRLPATKESCSQLHPVSALDHEQLSLVSAREPVSLDYVHLRPVSAHEHLKLVSAHEHLTLVSAHGHLTLVSVHELVDLSAHGHVLAHVVINFQIYLSDYIIVWMLV